MHSFGAVFVGSSVDPELGEIRVPRIVGDYDIGRHSTRRPAHSQLQGGIVWGVGLALLEHTLFDARDGRFVNANLAEYHVPVNADIGEIDVSVDRDDSHVNPFFFFFFFMRFVRHIFHAFASRPSARDVSGPESRVG